ncbi:hypothetical protein WKI65_43230 [Streptomyces sp. MS1.AVA.3]|uniref:hypothetical protein n=1 Tax=Streptomyces decoyicus TaxID=249567 RepID=UPI0030C51811
MTTTYVPAPGTEYRYAVSDIARKAAKLLGQSWDSESGYWGVTGQIHTPTGDTVTIGVITRATCT